MSDETNTPDTGIEDVTAQTPDTAEDLDYYDPDEDQDTDQDQDDTAPEDGAEEDEAAEEAEVVEAEANVDAVVTLTDGKKVKVADLIAGNLRQDDYTRKTQEVATERKTVRADAERIERITTAFIDKLSSLVPDMPDMSLALSNPNAYVAKKAQHEAALVQVKALIESADAAKEVAEGMSQKEKEELIAAENSKLESKIPQVATEQGRQKFFANAADVAQSVGFTMDDLKGVTDHRIFVLAHYAKMGMEAEKARSVAKTKAQAAPPVAPRKPGQGTKGPGNVEAMRKLSRSGSIRDALKVDWE